MGAISHQSPSGCRFTTRVRLRIMNRPAALDLTVPPSLLAIADEVIE
jgi:hypothetical protein